MPVEPTFVMLLLAGERLVDFHSVRAPDAETARERIVADFANRPHRQSALQRWQADGEPVRQMGVRGSVTRRTVRHD